MSHVCFPLLLSILSNIHSEPFYCSVFVLEMGMYRVHTVREDLVVMPMMKKKHQSRLD